MDIFQAKIQIGFILYRNCILETLFPFTYELTYHMISSLRQKYNLINVMQKSYLKNTISVLHIILDISNVKIQEYSIYTEIVSYKHYFKNIANLHSHALEEPSIGNLGERE